MKAKYTLLTSLIFGLGACGSNDKITSTSQENTSFGIKNSEYSEPTARPSPGHALSEEEIKNLPEADSSFQYTQGQPMAEQKPILYYPNTELGSKHVPIEEYSKYFIQPGIIEVVLKDEYHLRIDKSKNETDLQLISHSNTQAAQELTH